MVMVWAACRGPPSPFTPQSWISRRTECSTAKGIRASGRNSLMARTVIDVVGEPSLCEIRSGVESLAVGRLGPSAEWAVSDPRRVDPW